MSVVYVPDGQGVHPVKPAVALNEPAGHGTHDTAPLGASAVRQPAGHGVQALVPEALAMVPGTHGLQASAAGDEVNVPTGHAAQEPMPE